MRGRVEVSMGEGGRDVIPRERVEEEKESLMSPLCERDRISETHRRERHRGNACGAGDTHHIIPSIFITSKLNMKDHFTV